MKTKQEKIVDGIERLENLKQETILRYTDEIDFDQALSLYDVMINHFVEGDLDDAFSSDVFNGMSDSEKTALFSLVKEFSGLCFYNGDVEYWLDSLENTQIADADLISYSIFNCFEYLLELAKDGGRDVLELLVSLRASEDLKNAAIVNYLRNTFVDDRVLSTVLLEMSKENGYYGMFTDEQKGILLCYPEGTLYTYEDDVIRITSPLVLGTQIYNNVNVDISIDSIDENNSSEMDALLTTLKGFYRNDDFDFYDEVLTLVDCCRDYVRKNNISLRTEFSDVMFDDTGALAQKAWTFGDDVLGSTYDTPYSGGSK